MFVKTCMLSAGSSGGCLGFLAIQPAQGIGLQACRASWEMCYTVQITAEQKFCIKDSHLQGTLFHLSDKVRNYVQYVVKAFLKQARIWYTS